MPGKQLATLQRRQQLSYSVRHCSSAHSAYRLELLGSAGETSAGAGGCEKAAEGVTAAPEPVPAQVGTPGLLTLMALRTIMMASCRDRSVSSMNCSAPPRRIIVHVLAFGQPVKRLYLPRAQHSND